MLSTDLQYENEAIIQWAALFSMLKMSKLKSIFIFKQSPDAAKTLQ